MRVGTAAADPGERATGRLTVTDLPTGQSERLPVVVVEGSESGPTVWVTGTIHGDEPTGMAATHEFANRLRPEALAGTVVCVPVMNPAGLRTNERTSYYHGDDPNRYFGRGDGGETPPRTQQLVCERVYDEIRESADVVAAINIARLEGEVVETREVEPTAGELQVIKDRSREAGEDNRAIGEGLARKVATGQLTLAEALERHREDD